LACAIPTMEQTKASRGAKVRKWFRIIHRELSYVFAGMLLVYAISGIALNHKNSFNSQYSITRTEYRFAPATQATANQAQIDAWLSACGVSGQEIQHYFPDDNTLKVFLRGNSNLVVDLPTGNATLEQVRKRPVLGSLSKLHYNPGKAWTCFSDVFAVSLILIILTGLFMLKGKHGLVGIGGIEFLIGILIPLLFILL